MKATVLALPGVSKVLSKFVFAELYTDRGPDPDENNRLLKERFGSNALPFYVTLSPDGRERSRLLGMASEEKFLEFLRKGLEEPISGAK